MGRPWRRSRRLRRILETTVPVALFGVLSLTLFGRGVAGDPANVVVGDAGADKTLYMWSLKWWPRSLAGGRNPLDVDVAWAPHGFDLGLNTAGGGLALAAAPLTSALGAVVVYNALILAAPALAATTAFLLARHLTGSFMPAVVTAYIFGFSAYEVGHLVGHLPLAFIALVPLAPYLVSRRLRNTLSRPVYVAELTAVLVFQFLIVPQILFTLVLVATVAAAAALAVVRAASVRRVLIETGVAVMLTAILLSPFWGYAIASEAAAPGRSPFAEAADVLAYVVPTRRTWLRPPGLAEIAERFTATGAEQGAYLGVPFLILGALALAGRRRCPLRVVIATVFVSSALLSFGTRVKVAGEVVAVGPWSVLAAFPVVRSALPIRLTLYTSLLAALLVAFALADRPTVTRWLLVVVGVAMTLPNFSVERWTSPVERPSFFASGRDERYIGHGSTALLLPYGPAGWSMLWQAETGFRFRIIGGHFGLRLTPAEYCWRDVYEGLTTGRVNPSRLRRFLATHDVDVVVVAPGTRGRVRRVVEAAVGETPAHVFDVLVYAVPERRLAPDCQLVRAATQAPARSAIKEKTS